MQIQGQLAVCKLKECDYIECIFKSLETAEEYLELNYGTTDTKHGTAVSHGVIAEFYNQKGEYVYFYSEPDRTPKECLEYIQIITDGIIKDNGSGSSVSGGEKLRFSKYTYWRLDEMIIQRVVFNAKEWETIIPKINTFWEKVEEYKLLPIEIGIKKYQFVDDEEADEANAKADEANANAKTDEAILAKATKYPVSAANKYKFVDDDE
jgi:hypothetical protein